MDEATKVIEAPQWLKDQMEALKKLPPPTLEQVERQFRACEEQSFRNPYKDVNYIR